MIGGNLSTILVNIGGQVFPDQDIISGEIRNNHNAFPYIGFLMNTFYILHNTMRRNGESQRKSKPTFFLFKRPWEWSSYWLGGPVVPRAGIVCGCTPCCAGTGRSAARRWLAGEWIAARWRVWRPR